jgi:PAS domain S-box-containing protein
MDTHDRLKAPTVPTIHRDGAVLAQQRLAAIVASSDDAIIGKTLEGIITDWSPGAERLFGYRAAEVLGRPKTILFPPDRLDEEEEILRQVRAGRFVEPFETIRRRKDGALLHVSLSVSPIRDSTGQIVGASTIARDITGRLKTEKHLRFLARAGEVLASSLDYETTLQKVAWLVVPELADWCLIHLLDDQDTLVPVGLAHIDPVQRTRAEEYNRRFPPDRTVPGGPYAVTLSGAAEWEAELTPELIREVCTTDTQFAALSELGMRSYICAPLSAHGVTLGALTLISSRSERLYDEQDAQIAQEIARRAALAVENARLYRAERERSEQLSLAISEVHHRIKNSLQSVSALLEMQLPQDGGSLVPIEAVRDSLNQIKTIALVHDLLARDKPIGTVGCDQVLTNLGRLMAISLRPSQRPLSISVDADALELPTKAATSLALAVNELLTNAAKHRRPDEAVGPITVTLRQESGCARVTVSDSGPGFPQDFELVRDASIGLQIVQALVEFDLGGTIACRNTPTGAQVQIVFPTAAIPA